MFLNTLCIPPASLRLLFLALTTSWLKRQCPIISSALPNLLRMLTSLPGTLEVSENSYQFLRHALSVNLKHSDRYFRHCKCTEVCEISSSHGGEYHPWWWRQYAPLKRRSTIILHGSITHKTTLNIVQRFNFYVSQCPHNAMYKI
jgi:hypothetical protein